MLMSKGDSTRLLEKRPLRLLLKFASPEDSGIRDTDLPERIEDIEIDINKSKSEKIEAKFVIEDRKAYWKNLADRLTP